MTSLEPLIALVVGAGFTAGATLLARFLSAQKLLKYGPLISRIYDVVDPLLERNMRQWSGSDVEFAIELAIQAVVDGNLTAKELRDMVGEISQRWLPQVAADKVRKFEQSAAEPKALAAADVLADVISGTVTKQEALAKAKELLK
jgi:hypothetical protein